MKGIFIAHPKTKEQMAALKAIMKVLNIKFEIATKSAYNKDFLEKIKKGDKEFEQGDFTRVEKEDLKKILDL